jgi:hypothetical protein
VFDLHKNGQILGPFLFTQTKRRVKKEKEKENECTTPVG